MSKALEKRFDPSLPAVQAAINQLEVAMGGRQALVDALSTGTDPDTDYLLGLIADPRNTDISLAKLCDQGNITPGRLLQLYRDAKIARAQVLSIDKVAAAAPAVAEDVMRRAQVHEKICDECHGRGTVTKDGINLDCPECAGTGKIQANASLEHQKMALEMTGLLVKGSGIGNQMNVVNMQTPTGPQPTGMLPFAALQLAVQKVLNPPQDSVVEAEVVSSPQTSE